MRYRPGGPGFLPERGRSEAAELEDEKLLRDEMLLPLLLRLQERECEREDENEWLLSLELKDPERFRLQ